MLEHIVAIIVGIIIIVLGVINTTGNISLLHSYHRKRVKPEDVIPFGKRIGLGTIIVGSSISVCGGLELTSMLIERKFITYVGYGILVVGFVIGICIIIYALKKYNKGIF